MAAPRRYSDELRERAVWLHRGSEPRPTFRRLGEQLNVHPEARRIWVRQAEPRGGKQAELPTTDMAAENQQLAQKVREPQRVNEILRATSAYFAAEIGPTRSSKFPQATYYD